MTSFDTMFPNRLDCYFALFQDAVYEHDYKMNYVFEAGQFKRKNRVAVVNKVKAIADAVYGGLIEEEDSFNRCQPLINFPSLLSV